MSKRCQCCRNASSACYFINCFSVSPLQRVLWKLYLEGRVNKYLSLYSQCYFITLFLQKKTIVSFLKKSLSLSAEMRLGEQRTVFFHNSILFLKHTEMIEPILKHSKLKCSPSYSRWGPFILFCFFVHRVMTDLPSLLAHLPLRQVTGKGRMISENKIKMPARLFVLWREGSICSHLCMWHCCAWEFTQLSESP